MIFARKLENVDKGIFKSVSDVFEVAQDVGLDLIEVQVVNNNHGGPIVPSDIVGYVVPKSIKPLGDVIECDDDDGIVWVEDKLAFFPNRSSTTAYGYVFDCLKNRELLASSLSSGWFTIVDKKIKDQLIELCEERGWVSDILAKPTISIKKSTREITTEKQLANKQRELEDAQAKYEKLMKEIQETKEVSENFKKKRILEDKPLLKTKIPNREEAKKKLEGSK